MNTDQSGGESDMSEEESTPARITRRSSGIHTLADSGDCVFSCDK